MEAHGGDTIETLDGRVGVVVVTSYSLRGDGAVVYGISRDCDDDGIISSRHALDVPERRVLPDEIARIVAYGRHDYRPGTRRGYCARCDVQKRAHA